MHILIVGGTGMLRGVMEHYRKTFKTVSVLAQSKKDLEKLEKRYPGIIRGVPVDYMDEAALCSALKDSTEKHGRYDMAVVWLQDAPVAIPLCIAEFIGTPEKKGRLVHVRPINAAGPGVPVGGIAKGFTALSAMSYQEIILGFVREGTVSRWLDHEEITEGIVAAIDKGEPRTVIGTVTPWGERPLKAGRG